MMKNKLLLALCLIGSYAHSMDIVDMTSNIWLFGQAYPIEDDIIVQEYRINPLKIYISIVYTPTEVRVSSRVMLDYSGNYTLRLRQPETEDEIDISADDKAVLQQPENEPLTQEFVDFAISKCPEGREGELVEALRNIGLITPVADRIETLV